MSHAFAGIKLTDNIVQFETGRYNENPLVVQGPGAGPEVTAGGVFGDLLRLATYLGATL
ncbi:MAG: homoserine dehydrogenase, partial [Bradymonadaceae bacterium]